MPQVCYGGAGGQDLETTVQISQFSQSQGLWMKTCMGKASSQVSPILKAYHII